MKDKTEQSNQLKVPFEFESIKSMQNHPSTGMVGYGAHNVEKEHGFGNHEQHRG